MSILLADDPTIRDLNSRYRGQDKPTDVLSFGQMQDGGARLASPGPPDLLGDVVISVETAKRQAAAHGHALQSEVELLVAHGVLHLLGYDDETDRGADEMREREREILCARDE